MKRILSVMLVVCFAITLSAQDNTGNIWYFGRYAGIDFNSGSPVAITNGALNTIEGCSTICDNNGSLLFYTNGENVYNDQHTLMPNGTGLFGGYSSSQSALIVPDPGAANLYYIFTVDQIGGPNGLSYSVVDMSLDSAHGDVTLKNIPLLNYVPLAEKLTGTMHANGQDVWVCVHGKQSDTLYAFQVTPTGINPPIKNKMGSIHNVVEGCMRFSADGSKLASVQRTDLKMDLFDFDNSTGLLSDPATYNFPYADYPYGLEFSPGGNMLYVTTQNDTSGYMYQFALGASTNAGNVASPQKVYAIHTTYYGIEFWGMQAAPDGKIYVSFNQDAWIGAIDYPELPGMACNVRDSSLYLLGTYLTHGCQIGLENHISNYQPVYTETADVSSPGSTVSVYPNPCASYITFSLPATALNNNCRLKVYDSRGRCVMSSQLLVPRTRLSTGGLQPGLYFYEVYSGDKRAGAGKVVVQK